MNKKNLIFFADKGLTSTSANHIANMAKESYAVLESKLSKFSFIDKVVLFDGVEKTLTKGESDDFIIGIQDSLSKIASYKSLIAWIREAISAKNEELERLECLKSHYDPEFKEYLDEIGFKQIDINIERQSPITEDDIISEMPMAERVRFYVLEAQAANIGKLIHSGGAFANARKNALELNGTSSIDNNRLYTYNYSCNQDAIESKFFELQDAHRSINAELNSIKFKIDTQVKDLNMKQSSEYALRMQKWNSYKSEIENHMEIFRKIELKKIGNFKIVIPDSLKVIYETLI